MIQKGGGFGKRGAAAEGVKKTPELPRRPTDKRHEDRETAFKNAQIFIGGGKALSCAVRNVSEDGCMISLLGAENLPEELQIRLDPAHPRQHARVVWRDHNDAGLEFLPDE